MADLAMIRKTLEAHGQGHLLQYYDELTEPEQNALLEQLAGIDFGRIDEYVERYVRERPSVRVPGEILPPDIVPAHPTGDLAEECEQARKRGEELLSAGKVAAFVVAGVRAPAWGTTGRRGASKSPPSRTSRCSRCLPSRSWRPGSGPRPPSPGTS